MSNISNKNNTKEKNKSNNDLNNQSNSNIKSQNKKSNNDINKVKRVQTAKERPAKQDTTSPDNIELVIINY